jgi:hypothetical protein
VLRKKGKGVATDSTVTDAQGDADKRKSSTRSQLSTSTLADLAARIRAEHDLTLSGFKQGMMHALRVGELLIEAKRQLNKHGQWLPWLAENCPNIEKRTAQVYMRLVKHRAEIEAKTQNAAHLGIGGALQLLASHTDAKPSTSPADHHAETKPAPEAEIIPPVPEPKPPTKAELKAAIKAERQAFAERMERNWHLEKVERYMRGNVSPEERRDERGKIITEGHHARAKEAHPEMGGSHEEMVRVNKTRGDPETRKQIINTGEWWKQESRDIAAQMAKHFTIKEISKLCGMAIDLRKATQAQAAEARASS